MDIKSIIVVLAICNLLFGVELFLFKSHKLSDLHNPFWIAAKFFQCIGWSFIALRPSSYAPILITAGNISLLTGWVYAYLALRRVTGSPITHRLHITTVACVVVARILFATQPPNIRMVFSSVMMLIIFGLMSWQWMTGSSVTKQLRNLLVSILAGMIGISGMRAFWSISAPPGTDIMTGELIPVINIYGFFFVTLVTDFGMLLISVAQRTTHLADALKLNQTILLESPFPMGVYDTHGQCVQVNDAYAEMIGTTKQTLLSQNFNTIRAWQTSGLQAACLAAIQKRETQNCHIHTETSYGKEVFLDCRISLTEVSGVRNLLVQFIDLTERKRMEEELRNLAFHDSLTKLPNRRLLLDRMDHAIKSSARQASYGAILFLDLDRFKQLNDAEGHEVGDRLLIEVALRLKSVVRESDTVARLGGDEFVVLLEGLGNKQDSAKTYVDSITGKISDSLRVDFMLGTVRHRASASIGTKLFLGDIADANDLLKSADVAMYESKKAGARVSIN